LRGNGYLAAFRSTEIFTGAGGCAVAATAPMDITAAQLTMPLLDSCHLFW